MEVKDNIKEEKIKNANGCNCTEKCKQFKKDIIKIFNCGKERNLASGNCFACSENFIVSKRAREAVTQVNNKIGCFGFYSEIYSNIPSGLYENLNVTNTKIIKHININSCNMGSDTEMDTKMDTKMDTEIKRTELNTNILPSEIHYREYKSYDLLKSLRGLLCFDYNKYFPKILTHLLQLVQIQTVDGRIVSSFITQTSVVDCIQIDAYAQGNVVGLGNFQASVSVGTPQTVSTNPIVNLSQIETKGSSNTISTAFKDNETKKEYITETLISAHYQSPNKLEVCTNTENRDLESLYVIGIDVLLQIAKPNDLKPKDKELLLISQMKAMKYVENNIKYTISSTTARNELANEIQNSEINYDSFPNDVASYTSILYFLLALQVMEKYKKAHAIKHKVNWLMNNFFKVVGSFGTLRANQKTPVYVKEIKNNSVIYALALFTDAFCVKCTDSNNETSKYCKKEHTEIDKEKEKGQRQGHYQDKEKEQGKEDKQKTKNDQDQDQDKEFEGNEEKKNKSKPRTKPTLDFMNYLLDFLFERLKSEKVTESKKAIGKEEINKLDISTKASGRHIGIKFDADKCNSELVDITTSVVELYIAVFLNRELFTKEFQYKIDKNNIASICAEALCGKKIENNMRLAADLLARLPSSNVDTLIGAAAYLDLLNNTLF